MKHPYLIWLLLYLFWIPPIFAFEDIETLFVKANTAYKENDMTLAQKYYLDILKQGFCNGYLFYNVGNTYLRQGKIGESLFFYELAKKWIPRYPELQENYRIAREQNALPQSQIPLFFQVLFYWHLNTTINEECLLALVAFLGMLFGFYLRKSTRFSQSFGLFAFSSFCAIFWILTLFGAGYKIYQEHSLLTGILLHSKTKVYFGPSTTQECVQVVKDSQKTDLLLPEGLLFQIESKTQNEEQSWWQVRFENGVRGWILAQYATQIEFPSKLEAFIPLPD